MLWFGWFFFNAAAFDSLVKGKSGLIMINTLLSSCGGGIMGIWILPRM